MHTFSARKSSIILLAAMLLVLVIGAVAAGFGGFAPERSWGGEASAQGEGEPAQAAAAGSSLVDAQRAASSASAQAGFLTSGAKQLADGTQKLNDAAQGIPAQFDEAVKGAQTLSEGMIQIQAGTGQLGSGATELADGVGTAVDQVVGVAAMRGQLLAAVDSALEDTKNIKDPDVVEMRKQLQGFRSQLETAELGDELTGQLTRLKDGSRELANQLNTPGYAYHDGIYSATEGSKRLAGELTAAQQGVGEAISGASQLNDGAQKVNAMAKDNQARIGDVARALPGAAQPGASQAADEQEQGSALSPLVALLVAAVVMFGGTVMGMARAFGFSLDSTKANVLAIVCAILAVVGFGEILLWLLSNGVGAGALGASAVVMAFGVVAAMGISDACIRVFGAAAGSIAVTLVGLAQVGFVGWVWKSAANGGVASWASSVANVFPLNWATTGLTSLGNGIADAVMWSAVAVLAVVALLGGWGLTRSRVA